MSQKIQLDLSLFPEATCPCPRLGAKAMDCKECCPGGKCPHPHHTGHTKKARSCPECNPWDYCRDPSHWPAGKKGPRTCNSCIFCRPSRFCVDSTHRGGYTKQVVYKQSCPDCCPDRFCPDPDHHRGKGGRPKVKKLCFECHPEEFCFKAESPKIKRRCVCCGGKTQKKYDYKRNHKTIVPRTPREARAQTRAAKKMTAVVESRKRPRSPAPHSPEPKRQKSLTPLPQPVQPMDDDLFDLELIQTNMPDYYPIVIALPLLSKKDLYVPDPFIDDQMPAPLFPELAGLL